MADEHTDGWRCECGDLNGEHEAFCYRCGACGPEVPSQVATGDDARRALVPLDDLAMSGVLVWLVGYLGHAADADMSLTAGKVLALIVERCDDITRRANYIDFDTTPDREVLRSIRAVADATGVDPLSKLSTILGMAQDALSRRPASMEKTAYSEALEQIMRVTAAPPRRDRDDTRPGAIYAIANEALRD